MQQLRAEESVFPSALHFWQELHSRSGPAALPARLQLPSRGIRLPKPRAEYSDISQCSCSKPHIITHCICLRIGHSNENNTCASDTWQGSGGRVPALSSPSALCVTRRLWDDTL